MSTILSELKVITLDENASLMSFEELRDGKKMVIDFWHTECVKCPAAIERLNEEAESDIGNDTIVICCALSRGEGNKEMVSDLVCDWENMTHVFMDMEMKEEAKKLLGFTAVPFYVVVDKNGNITGKGDPKKIDYMELLNTEAQPIIEKPEEIVPILAPVENVFTLDEDF